MTNFTDMNRQDQQAYLMKPIIDELKQVGGQATTRDLKRAVVEREEDIPENTLTMYKTSRNGRKYLPFNFAFNFAISNLIMAGMLKRPKQGIVVLTEREENTKEVELNLVIQFIKSPFLSGRRKLNKIKRVKNLALT